MYKLITMGKEEGYSKTPTGFEKEQKDFDRTERYAERELERKGLRR